MRFGEQKLHFSSLGQHPWHCLWLWPHIPSQPAFRTDPYPAASHRFTTARPVQATSISSAEYLNSLRSLSVCFCPRICSPRSAPAPCCLHDFAHWSPLARGFQPQTAPRRWAPLTSGPWDLRSPASRAFFPRVCFAAPLNASRHQRGLSRALGIKRQISRTQYPLAQICFTLFYFSPQRLPLEALLGFMAGSPVPATGPGI